MSRDERLAHRAAQGDRRAFAEIYERYHQDLYRFCLALLGNPPDAQDALQNTMVKVLRALPGEKREIKLKPWLYRIARNESVETLRRRRDDAELSAEQGSEAGTAEHAATRERLRTLLADLEQLPERQRAALVMRELSGLDFTQIAAVFGTSAAVARQTLYEARLSLRQLEEGREMSCADVMRTLSDTDGRVTRRRDIRAHLRSCSDCRAFGEEISSRREKLAAIAPLPLAASAGLLHSVLGANASGAMGGGLAGPLGAGAGKVAATSAILKSAATVAVVAAVGVGTADRTHLIHLPLDGGSGDGAARHSAAHGAARRSGAPGAPASAADAARAVAPTAGNHRAGQGARGGAERNDSHGDPGGSQSQGVAGGAGSARGETPPGSGFGRSAAERGGAPESTPPATSRGQQTSGARKAPQATDSPPAGAGQGAAPPHGQSPSPPSPPAAGATQPPRPGAPEPPEAPPATPSPQEHPSGPEAEAAAEAGNRP
ncbi:MAG TPA: sigma-70 family RNA polymerase sigma factor [Solirubrobacterales bacterium]|nr:sigma-70 family RNA polymerase sigma factor [Solirubrobacterales bacterium]